jgi:hypothetical protein
VQNYKSTKTYRKKMLFRQINKFVIAALFYAASGSPAVADQVTINTRFGIIKSNQNQLLSLKGKPISPEVEIFSQSYVIATFKLAKSDVILVSQAAGNACPGQYLYITIDADDARVTPTFGTCYDDEINPVKIGDSTIAFSMKKAPGKGSVRYIYENGVVFENGKPIKQ